MHGISGRQERLSVICVAIGSRLWSLTDKERERNACRIQCGRNHTHCCHGDDLSCLQQQVGTVARRTSSKISRLFKIMLLRCPMSASFFPSMCSRLEFSLLPLKLPVRIHALVRLESLKRICFRETLSSNPVSHDSRLKRSDRRPQIPTALHVNSVHIVSRSHQIH